MTKTTSKYTIYRLRGLPPGVFGEAYVVVATDIIYQSTFRAEHYILTQRPQESLRGGTLDIRKSDLPSELGIVDADFAIEEGLRQAEIDIVDMLEKRSIELSRQEIALMSFDLQECHSPFVGCRMRGKFLKQISDIAESTKCSSLYQYLSLVQQVRVIM